MQGNNTNSLFFSQISIYEMRLGNRKVNLVQILPI